MSNYAKISNETRKIIIDNYEEKKSISHISEFLKIPRPTIYSIVKTYLQTGSTQKRSRGGAMNIKITDEIKEIIFDIVDNDPSISLEKISQKVEDRCRVKISKSGIDGALRRFHFSLKQVSFCPEARITELNEDRRKTYAREYIALIGNIDDSKIIFLDEVGFNISMRSKRGRAVRGQTPVVKVPVLRSRNISVCCAMTKNGILFKEINTRAYNAQSFLGYLQTFFTFLNEQNLQNCMIIMDNVNFHKSALILECIQTNGHSVKFLPPYSPTLNPIENLFSKWKAFIRASKPNNEDDLFHYLDDGLHTITPNDCGGYYRNMLRHINELI
jgi:transposase